MASHIECRFNKNPLLQCYFLAILPAGLRWKAFKMASSLQKTTDSASQHRLIVPGLTDSYRIKVELIKNEYRSLTYTSWWLSSWGTGMQTSSSRGRTCMNTPRHLIHHRPPSVLHVHCPDFDLMVGLEQCFHQFHWMCLNRVFLFLVEMFNRFWILDNFKTWRYKEEVKR